MVTPLKSVDPRVKRTRQLLQQALMDLFREKSFSTITVQDITERATVNRATFYAHFEDKYALLDAMIREQFQQAVTDKLPAGSRWSTTSIQILIQAIFDFLGQIHGHCRPSDSQFDPLIERAVQQELHTLLLNLLKQVPLSAHVRRVPIDTIASVMSWAIFGVAVQWSQGERSISSEQMTQQVLTVIADGVAHITSGLSTI